MMDHSYHRNREQEVDAWKWKDCSRIQTEETTKNEEYSHASKISKKSIKADKREYKDMLATNRRGGSPRKSTETVHHHKETVWKVWETRETCKGQERKAYPWWTRSEEETEGALWSVSKQTSSTGPARYPTSKWWPTDWLWPTHQEGNIPTVSQQDPTVSSRGIENWYRNQCEATVPPL